MSGVGTGMTETLAVIAGAVAGRVLTTKLSSKYNPKILAGAQIAVGLFAPKFIKNKLAQGVAKGMLINGGVSALQTFGVISAISGLGEMQDDYQYQISGGSSDISVISGDGEGEEMGFTDEGIMSGGSSDIAILAGMEGDGENWDENY
jgi:hypothetical protein